MELSGTYLATLFLAAVRVTSLLMVVPLFGARATPVLVKVGLGVLLALVILPPGAAQAGAPLEQGPFLVAILSEVVVGLLAGFSASLIFAAAQMAGRLAGMQLGLGLESVSEALAEGQGLGAERLYTGLAVLIFLSANGHHQLLLGLGELFALVPINGFTFPALITDRLIGFSAAMIIIGVRLALPIIAALFITDLALALIARVAPQMNIFFIGLPLKMAVGMLTILLALPLLVGQMEGLFGGIAADIHLLLGRG